MRIPRGSDALFLLQRVRDEAHRFAITYHRSFARQAHDPKRLGRDPPDWAPPAGLACCVSLAASPAVRRASLEDLLELKWLPDSTARAVYHQVHQVREPSPGEDPAADTFRENTFDPRVS